MTESIVNRLTKHLRLFYRDNPYVELLGIRVDNVEEGDVLLEMAVKRDHTNFYEMSHGGALMSLADTAMGAACLSYNKKVVTLSFNMSFIKGVPLGEKLIATGHVVHNGSRTMMCECELKNEDGKLFCKASGSFFVIGKLLAESK
ncbi:PaaI family thioesterase [uncultured Anaerovibrio sp.]|jgi:acyl-CoA thioesterase|uniref:PaaI family thioesterase n=1 Tax=uncultured Anaerovibrio sp. TaxID=361586 RepID=UPI0026393F94|nr:PaaI family thioesterase [uncultured Anaerovibrio sp.]